MFSQSLVGSRTVLSQGGLAWLLTVFLQSLVGSRTVLSQGGLAWLLTVFSQSLAGLPAIQFWVARLTQSAFGGLRRPWCDVQSRRFRSFARIDVDHPHDGRVNPQERKTRKRYEVPDGLRYLTFSCYHHLPLFNNDAIKDEFVRALDIARRRTSCRFITWIVMPTHVHMMVVPSLPQYPIPVFLGYLKAPFAKKVLARWKKLNAPILRRITDRRGRLHFWQVGGGYDRNIDSDEEYEEKFNYIHLNPKRAGLVDEPADWRWSSLPWYLGSRGPGILSMDV